MNDKYIPLYRKYRPQRLDELVGQEHIKNALSNAIKLNKISHAYLFTGPRGTGKTSTARIFAKSLNCKNGPTITPCGECESCIDIQNAVPMDVIEIDAASNRKVEDTQNILEKILYAPVYGKYKIYIIDEVHMLSNTAFNSLLKTLEEPPENVIFILATTEVHKVLDTIKSRCQRFDFRRITTSDIVKHLRYISDKEGINITDDALFTIAKNSAGGMRDSIALLDQLSVLGGENAITTDDINKLLGRISFDVLNKLTSCILFSKPQDAIEMLENIYNSGNEPVQIFSNLLDYLKNLLIVKNCREEIVFELTQLNEAQLSELKNQVKEVETHQLVALLDKCANYITELKLTANPKLWLDVAVLDMANLVENTKLDELQKRISQLESGDVVKMVNSSPYNTPPSPVKKQDIIQPVKPEIKQKPIQVSAPVAKPQSAEKQVLSADEVLTDEVPTSKSSSPDTLKLLWAKLLENISSFPSRTILKQQAIPVKITEDEVIISIKNQSWLKQFGPEGAKHSFIVQAAAAVFGKNVDKIIVRLPESGDNELRKEQSSSVAPVSVNLQSQSAEVAKPSNKEVEIVSEKTPLAEEKISKAPKEENLTEPDNSDVKSEMKVSVPKTKTFNGSADSYHSDGVNMVMDLFDGKFIE